MAAERTIQLVHNLRDVRGPEPLVLAVGFFDGFHRGHQAVLEEARRMAAALGASAGVVTFLRIRRRCSIPGSRCISCRQRQRKSS